MCGIAGVFGKSTSEEILKRLLDPITHRGEATHRYETYIAPNLSLGTHRLAIINESHGLQPFHSKDHKITVIFNGQIYNYKNLRQELKSDFDFRSHCDTETILAAYLKWGQDCVYHLDGQFAIAIYDDHIKQLLLIRDPMGIKPLYYCCENDHIFFASEVKALSKTVASKIIELEPGTIWSQTQQKKYISFGAFNSKDPEQTVYSQQQKNLKRSLTEAVHKRIGDEPKIACLLSGGIDSSIITYLASRAHNNVTAYTLAVPGKDSGDLQSAKLLTNFLGIKHIVVSPAIAEMQKFYLENAVYMTESFEPVLARNAVAYHFVCRKVAQDGFKYCLNGEGADELFGGYDFIREAPQDRQDQLIRHSLSIIHNSYLKMADRASMYTTLEARVPFMDTKFVKLALELPPQARLNDITNKVALREMFKNELPPEITQRRKVGMNEGSGFGVNKPMQSIYYEAVYQYYQSHHSHYEKDLQICKQDGTNPAINFENIEEVYNYARFSECGYTLLHNGSERLQLNTSLNTKIAA